MVDIERDVPGKTAEAICANPIQAAWGNDISSIRRVRGLRQNASTSHMITPPMNKAHAITQRFSRFCPICFFKRNAGTAVRSEEHTSELQSQFHLVCRLL